MKFFICIFFYKWHHNLFLRDTFALKWQSVLIFIGKPVLFVSLIIKQSSGENDVPFLTMSLKNQVFCLSYYKASSVAEQRLMIFMFSHWWRVITGRPKHLSSVMTLLTDNITFYLKPVYLLKGFLMLHKVHINSHWNNDMILWTAIATVCL